MKAFFCLSKVYSAVIWFSAAIWCTLLPDVLAEQQLPPSPYVFGYAGQLSAAQGETVDFHLSSSEAQAQLSVRRIGREDKRVLDKVAVSLASHSIPDRASSEGCHWPVAYSLQIPADWQSGYYIAEFIAGGDQTTVTASVFFVVREANPGSRSKILLQLATNTYNAYTNWGGHSLYSYHDRDGLQGNRVSFDRPLSSQFEKWEGPFVRWAEDNGYEIEYAVNSDLEFHPEILDHYRLVLSVGHDEYWSSPMRDSLEAFIGRGGNVAFFSGNTCCWQVRSEDNGRALTCWKQWFNMDPYFRGDSEHLLSSAWSHYRVGRPENQLTGVGFLWGGYHKSHGQFMDGPASYLVHRPEHWVMAGTQLKQNDRFGGQHTIVGYECDGCELRWENGLPFPTGSDGTPETFVVLGTCPARWAAGDSHWYERFPRDRVGAAVMGVYERGGTVFTSGSTDWAHGLQGKDPVVEQVTKNVLDRLAP